MTPQEIFDTVVTTLLKQGTRSVDKNKSYYGNPPCVYRNDQGHKCAAGILIPDDCYDEEMEGNSFKHLLLMEKYNFPEYLYSNKDLINELQFVHDMNSSWDEKNKTFSKLGWGYLKDIAVYFELEFSYDYEIQ